ncbi:MAG: hypothetical protein SVG88_04660 [Halobacteriales archaeon]|nr:hypothetical protein [Halobacteriales archaeon]
MTVREYVEMGIYGVLTLVFVGAGLYGLWLVLQPAIPSLAIGDIAVAVVFVLVGLAVVLLGAVAGSDEEPD